MKPFIFYIVPLIDSIKQLLLKIINNFPFGRKEFINKKLEHLS